MDGIGGRRFYAAKSMENDQGRRFYFAWAHDRADESNFGQWYWGGQFCIPHEVCQNPEGELDVKMPKEYIEAWNQPVEWSYKHILGGYRRYGERSVYLDSVSTLSYGFLEGQDYILEIKYDEFLPQFIPQLMETGCLRQVSYSKYRICRERYDGF